MKTRVIRIAMRFSDQQVRDWMERNDWKHSESEARTAMDDASSVPPIIGRWVQTGTQEPRWITNDEPLEP